MLSKTVKLSDPRSLDLSAPRWEPKARGLGKSPVVGSLLPAMFLGGFPAILWHLESKWAWPGPFGSRGEHENRETDFNVAAVLAQSTAYPSSCDLG